MNTRLKEYESEISTMVNQINKTSSSESEISN